MTTGQAEPYFLISAFIQKFVSMEESLEIPDEFPTPTYVIASLLNARLKDMRAAAVKKALLSDDKSADALDELIAVGEAVFTFIRYSDLDLPLRNAVSLLEKQFDFYRRLLDDKRDFPTA